MERKLIKQGGGGLTMYLPKKWIDARKLEDGDEVSLIEKENSIVVSAIKKGKELIEFDLDEKNKKDLIPIITHLYRVGFDTVKVNNVDGTSYKRIQSAIQDSLLGFEITERVKDKCTIENVSEPSGNKFDILLKRVFFLIDETIKIINEDYNLGNFKNKGEITNMKKDVDKNILFLKKSISKSLVDKDPVILWEFLTFLTHIEHNLFYLYDYMSDKKIEKNKDIVSLLLSLKDYFDLFNHAYYERSLEKIHKINSLKEGYQFGKCIDLLEKNRGRDNVIISYIRELYRLIQIGTSPILGDILKSQYKL